MVCASTIWRRKYPERAKEQQKRYRDKNKEKLKQYREANKERLNEASKLWKKNNPEKAAVIYRRQNLKAKYNLTVEEWDQMAENQGHKCAICETPRDQLKNNLAVDHDHETGEVRGLLCYACNRGIGLLKDSSDVLLKAAAYLKRKD